jgi:hypothetical protein
MFVKLAKWLWDGDVNETTVKVDYEKKLEEEKARYLEELKRERERKEREEELDEIAEEVKKVKKKVEKIDYTAIIIEALQSDAVLEAFAKMTDERLHDHIGVTNLIAEKIKEEIAPIKGKVTQIEEGVLAVETQMKDSNYNLQPTPAEIHIGEKVQREDREVNVTYQKKVREATKEVNEMNAKLEKIRKLEVANGGSFSAIQVRSSLRISSEDIQDFIFDLVDKSFIYEVEKKNGIRFYKTVR